VHQSCKTSLKWTKFREILDAMRKNFRFRKKSENCFRPSLTVILYSIPVPDLFLKLDPDPHSLKKLDPDPLKVDANPKHCLYYYAVPVHTYKRF
jgi:hypothetical protein